MKIFISYSHNDITIKNEIKEILLELKDNGYIDEIWDDEEIRHGDEFDKKIFDNLFDSDVALFIVTHNLWKSFYIPNIEIPLANKFFHTYSYPKIVSIVIEKEAFNTTYFPTLNDKDAIPQKDKNLIPYSDLDEKEAKKLLKDNLINLLKTIPKREKKKIDFYRFNNLNKTKNLIRRKKFNELEKWIKTDYLVAYIEGEEGVGKTVLAQDFGNFLWENGYLVIYLSSKEWKNYIDFRELFKRYIGAELTNEFLKGYKKDIVFILDGVNERERFREVSSLLANYEREKNNFQNQGINFNVRLLFTTRELKNYGLENEFRKYFKKIELNKYSDDEFCEAVKLNFKDLKCEEFSENIKEMAKYPRYFELTLSLKERLGDIKNITRELLYWEKLKQMIEIDETFKAKLKITSIDDIEEKLCKFIEEKIKDVDKKEKLKIIFEQNYDDIKSSLKEGKIVIKEAGEKVKINELLLKLSYGVYLVTKAKEKLLEKDLDFKDLANDIEKYVEPEKADIVWKIYFLILEMYSDIEEIDEKILLSFYYLWLNHQNSEITDENLKIIAKNLFKVYIKYLDLLEENKIRDLRFVDFDIYLIKILKDLWREDNFDKLREYVYSLSYEEINEEILNEINRKIAIISSNPDEIFLEKINELLNNDTKDNKIFFAIWNNLRIIYDGINFKNLNKLDEIKYVLNREDLLDGKILTTKHSQNVFNIINFMNKQNFYDKEGIGYLGCIGELIEKKEIEKVCNYLKNISFSVFNNIDKYFSFFANYDSNCLKQLYLNFFNKIFFELGRLKDMFAVYHLNMFYIKFYNKNNISHVLSFLEKELKQLEDKPILNYLNEISILKIFIEHFLLFNPDEILRLCLKYTCDKLLEDIIFSFKLIEKKDIVSIIKKNDVKNENVLFFASFFKIENYNIKEYLLKKIQIRQVPNIYFYLLTKNFDFKDYIFNIIQIDKNRPRGNTIFSTSAENRKIIDYLIENNVAYFNKLLVKNSNLFKDYSYEKLKEIFGIKGLGFLLLDREDELLRWFDEIKENISYLEAIDIKEPLKRLLEINPDKFNEFFDFYFENIKKTFKTYGRKLSGFNILDYGLLEVMFNLNKEKSINTFFEFIKIYGIYNDFSKFLFKQCNNKNILLRFIHFVKNDYDILMLTILFLKNEKKDILFNYLKKNLLNSENSFDRQFALSFIRWFGDNENLSLIKNIWKSDKSGYVRYFAELCYYVCLKEKNFKINYEEAILEEDLEKFSIKLLALRTCVSPANLVAMENIYKKYKNIIDNFDPKKKYFFESFINKFKTIFNENFEIFGYKLKNYIAGEKIDKYKKIILGV